MKESLLDVKWFVEKLKEIPELPHKEVSLEEFVIACTKVGEGAKAEQKANVSIECKSAIKVGDRRLKVKVKDAV